MDEPVWLYGRFTSRMVSQAELVALKEFGLVYYDPEQFGKFRFICEPQDIYNFLTHWHGGP